MFTQVFIKRVMWYGRQLFNWIAYFTRQVRQHLTSLQKIGNKNVRKGTKKQNLSFLVESVALYGGERTSDESTRDYNQNSEVYKLQDKING